jgi:predicted NBD/HSP70 family sugar kinase
VPLARLVAGRLGWSVPVLVGNESDLGMLAEVRRGAAIGVDDLIYLHGEVGVGAGIYAGGRPLTGAAGYAGELGHFPIEAEGARCRCGSRGCWETVVGTEALLVRAGRPADSGDEGVAELLSDAAAGDRVVLGAIEETGRRLGIGLAGFVNVFNPRLVVLGGLFGRLEPFAHAAIVDGLDERALPASRAMVRVVPAALREEATLLGAAELALEGFLDDPSAWLAPSEAAGELATA